MEHANRIALHAIRGLLEGARPMTLEVAGRPVEVRPSEPRPTPWPAATLAGLSEAEDGPWPPTIRVSCAWEGGQTTLEVSARLWSRGDANVAFAVQEVGAQAALTFVNLARLIGTHPDAGAVSVSGYFAVRTRKGDDVRGRAKQAAALKRLVQESKLPLLSTTSVDLGQVRYVPGVFEPSPTEAFRRLLHLSLYKLDFFSQGPRASARGRPLIDLAAHGLEGAPAPEDQDGDGARAYWAGGFGEPERLERFLRDGVWEMGWARDDEATGAKKSWRAFDQIRVGDWFAITGFGGNYQLSVKRVGEVTEIDPDAGRIALRELPECGRYKGPAPRGSGAGSWFETLVPVTREDVIALIFGGGEKDGSEPAVKWEGPKNLILYGPPGTGKTYFMSEDLFPKFTRSSRSDGVDAETAAELGWLDVVGAALVDLGGEGNLRKLSEHPFVRAKYQAKDFKTPLSARVGGTLQRHSVAESQTVIFQRRGSRLVFDKRGDSTWFFPGGIPEDLAQLAAELRAVTKETSQDYVFVTFHQSYAYEDFIEGIRPRTLEDEEGGSTLVYELEDGVFMRAAQAAARLAGFTGTLDELARRPREERAKLFEDAPLYAVFVDEINRGNVSRIFGELITLLEDDKRLGAGNELIVTLPYSRRRFGVPPNLCLIGTMNTADRSVEALDTALRRRFSFLECPPDYTTLADIVVDGEVDVARLLRVVNARLERLLDRDHQIGHAYFMPLGDDPSIDRLKEIFGSKILPLLSEYFYADLGRVGLVLGGAFVQRVPEGIRLARFEHDAADELAERATYRLVPVENLSTSHFRSIYEES
jgi:hypothetical protein